MAEPTVFIIYEDSGVRASLAFLLHAHDRTLREYDTPAAFLAEYVRGSPGCLLLGHKIAQQPALDVLLMLRGRGVALPAVICGETVSPTLKRRAARLGAVIIQSLAPVELNETIGHALAAGPRAARADE